MEEAVSDRFGKEIMLAAIGVALLLSAFGAFKLKLRNGIYRRYMPEELGLVVASVLVGLVAVVSRPGVVASTLLGLEIVALATLVWYLTSGSRFPRGELSVREGQRFPRLRLVDSTGEPFDSRSLLGETAALYLFYRGDW